MKILTSALLLLACLALSGQGLVAQQIRLDAGTELLVPSSARTGNFTSLLVVINLDTQPNNVTITARSSGGAILGNPINTTISVGARFRSIDILGDMGVPVGPTAFGPIRIQSNNLKVFSAVSQVYTPKDTGGFFPGVNVASAWLQGYISEVADTGQRGQAGTYRTNLGVNTMDATPANVTVTLHDDSGAVLGTANLSVQGNGMTQVNVAGSIPALSGRDGYLKIQSDRPVHAWASKLDNLTDDASYEIGIGALTSGSVSQVAPAISDLRNNLLFIGLALIAPFVLALRRNRVNFPAGADQRVWAMETL
jgi:hypothetical protein